MKEPITVNGEICQWYALCDHEATGTLSHPILGEVPICDRCREKDAHLASQTETGR